MSGRSSVRRNNTGTKDPLRLTFSDGSTRVLNRRSHTNSCDSSDSMTPLHQHNKNGGYLQHRYFHPSTDIDRREKITINVSGERYQTYVETLNRFPDTLLGNTTKREEFYDDVEDEYFFDRDRSAFNAILYYYQSKGHLYCPLTVPMTILVTEAKFFDLGNDALKQVLDLQCEDNESVMPINKWQRKIWCLFEHPETSRSAHLLTLFSVLMIIFSVTILCVETLPFARKNTIHDHEDEIVNTLYQKRSITENYLLNITYQNKTVVNIAGNEKLNQYALNYDIKLACSCSSKRLEVNDNNTEPFMKKLEEFNWHDIFSISEAVFVAWFTFEFIIRLCTSPSKIDFLKRFLNIMDIVSILPFYITSALNRHQGLGLENFRVIRLVRVFRIFKLSRHSKGLQILGETLRASMRELGLMIFFLAIGVILFSSAVYYLEDTNFSSIPDAFWWAIITMCTVGYGDKVPKTFWGKVVGSACSICGVLSIALPVPVIVSNFDYFYNRERTKKMHQMFITEDDDDDDDKDDECSSNKKLATEMEKKNDEESPPCKKAITFDHNGSLRSLIKSPVDTRADEIQRQATIKGLEKRSRKLSQKLSEASLFTPAQPLRRYGNGNGRSFTIERETLM